MRSIFSYKSIRDFLKDELARRVRRNSKYSLRSFARDIGYSDARLSRFLNKFDGISLHSVSKIASNLRFDELETSFFINLAVAEFGRTKQMRADALKLVNSSKPVTRYRTYKQDDEKLLHEWFHLPVLQWVGLHKTVQSAVMAKQLGITEQQVLDAIQILVASGHLKRDSAGQYSVENNLIFVRNPKQGPNTQIRKFNKKMVALGLDNMDLQPVDNRSYLCAIVDLDKKNLQEARREIQNFCIKLTEKYSTRESANSLYCLALQFYQLDYTQE